MGPVDGVSRLAAVPVQRDLGRSWAARDHLDGTPVIADGVVVVGANDGRVSAVALADGALRWEFALGGPVTGSAAIADGMIYVGCEDGTLYALRPPP